MRRIWLTLSIFGLAVLVPASSQAGYVAIDSASCTKDADGSGFCTGTLRGFRKSGGANDRATFSLQNGLVTFSATLNGKNYVCGFYGPADNTYAWLFAQAVTQGNGTFLIAWDTTGGCTTNGYTQGSPYSTYQ